MSQIYTFVVLSVLYIDVVWSQSGTTSDGQSYICVPPGTCPSSNNTNGIDPRIVTPGVLCPPGLVPCFGTAAQCGLRFIPPNSTADGIADYGAYPWQAYLRNATHSFAGSGVLLDSYHILTAAHKVALNVATPTAVTAIMGLFNPTSLANTQSSTVSRIVIHPMYDSATLRNDIAILRLTTPIVIGVQRHINTACLPPAGMSYVGQRCVVSGWGQTAFTTSDAPTNPMKQVFVNIVNYATCRTSYSALNLLGVNVDRYLDPNGEICAGGEAMRDACTQDGGSPLVCPDNTGRYSVVGLVIWGKNCGLANVYGVYVSVSAYRNWIDTTIQSLN